MAGLMERGEIWVAGLEPGYGREIHKKRPALIISSESIIKHTPYVIIIPISSIVPQQIGIEMVRITQEEGLDKKSVALPIFIRSIDENRLIKKITTLTEEKMSEVEEALKLVLGISD